MTPFRNLLSATCYKLSWRPGGLSTRTPFYKNKFPPYIVSLRNLVSHVMSIVVLIDDKKMVIAVHSGLSMEFRSIIVSLCALLFGDNSFCFFMSIIV